MYCEFVVIINIFVEKICLEIKISLYTATERSTNFPSKIGK